MSGNETENRKDVDKLLLEIGLAGSMYGIGPICQPIFHYLKQQGETHCHAILGEALSCIVMGNYDLAIEYLSSFKKEEVAEKFHKEADALIAIAYKMAGKDEDLETLRSSIKENELVATF